MFTENQATLSERRHSVKSQTKRKLKLYATPDTLAKLERLKIFLVAGSFGSTRVQC